MADLQKLTKRIPGLDHTGLMQMWQNAVEILDDRSRMQGHCEARQVKQLIQDEWRRRTIRSAEGDYFSRPASDSRLGSTEINAHQWPLDGVLSFMGYHVGNAHGRCREYRHLILSEIFSGELPPIYSAEHMREWDRPGTAQRLRKLAEALASFARNEERRNIGSLDRALREREEDLAFLHDQYYEDQLGFGWPSVS